MKSFCWTLFLFIGASLIISIVIFVSLHNEKSSDKILNNEELFELSIIHINDFHSRFEETNELSLQCQEYEKCIGGFARMKNVIDQLKANRKNAILLNAGDNFQGTSWYSLFRYNVTSHMLNFIDADATTIGTHDFTHGVNGLVPFLKILNSPVVVCNIDDRHEPSIQNLYQKSVIVTRNGRKIGIIGVILQETRDIANTDNINFKNEADSIRDESTNLRQKGVNIIVVLSHCGLERDRQIALETGDFVDIIVGGHSHHFLYTTFDKSSPGPDIPIGPYPIVVTPKSGNNRKVLIVQASAFTKYVGDLKVYFNSLGHVKYYEGNPIFLSSNVERDPDILHELIPWREEINRLSQRVVGYSKVNLMNIGCRRSECVLGSFLADACRWNTIQSS
ncbi:CLUMA_CG020264, isoform A [Clunio marinus]|uniref:apyrase n=1 Tax=Clunio marinus TaxID=568069 RepID=A0A1J1J4F1_9DIPT|nr:CLUMA_CG020264, isoform A [Clunio marinus]